MAQDKQPLAKKTMGRPTKYKKEYCDMLIKHMDAGYSYYSFAAIVNVCQDTLYEWSLAQEDFKTSIDIGRAKRLFNYECTMAGLANGTTQGSTQAMIYRFKNLNSKSAWKDNPVDEYTQGLANQGIQITFTKSQDVTLSEVMDD